MFFILPFLSGRPGGTRTPNFRFWRPTLYQLNYWPKLEPTTGIEPVTSSLPRKCSTTEPCGRPINNNFNLLLRGAGDGNRTHAISLEGWSSTIELHPRINSLKIYCTPIAMGIFKGRTAILPLNGWAQTLLKPAMWSVIHGGGGRIRTFEGWASRFTVCPLWPLGNPSTKLRGLFCESQG